MDALAVDFIRGVMRDTARRTDAMLELQGKVTSFKFEKRIAELEGVVAGLRRELSEKNSEIGRLTTEKQNVEAEADKQAAEHANQLALKDAELSRLRGEVEPERAGAAAAALDASEQRRVAGVAESKLCEVELLKVTGYLCFSVGLVFA
jgi:septal ring factor EnvC (AmiA/AmiB activator)